MGVSGAKEVKFTTGLPLLQVEKELIELKLIDGVGLLGCHSYFATSMNVFVNNVKNIQNTID